jgi:hypothetical protein
MKTRQLRVGASYHVRPRRRPGKTPKLDGAVVTLVRKTGRIIVEDRTGHHHRVRSRWLVAIPPANSLWPDGESVEDDDWSWETFVAGSVGIVGLFTVIALSSGGFFVEKLSTIDYLASGALVVGGLAIVVHGIRVRSAGVALFGVFLSMLGVLGVAGVPQCHVDCGGPE